MVPPQGSGARAGIVRNVLTRTSAGIIVPAVANKKFHILYMDVGARNNSAVSDGVVTITATVNAIAGDIYATYVPVGAADFAVSKSLSTDIETDTNTNVNVALTGIAIFEVVVGGYYL